MPEKSYDLDGLATALVMMFGLTAVASLVGALFKPILILVSLFELAQCAVFLTWFYRARQNAGFLDGGQRYSPWWTVFGWFVPVCFLWFPYQIMADIWRAGQSTADRAKFPYLLAAWWACWCLAWFTGYRHGTTSTETSASSSYGLSFGGTVPSLVFAAGAAVLLAVIVKRVSDGPVGRVGRLSSSYRFQPGVQPPVSG